MAVADIDRRRFMGKLGMAGAGAAIVGTGLGACSREGPDDRMAAAPRRTIDVVPFRGAHQAGIVTPVQDRLVFAAFDVVTTDANQLGDLLDRWTTASAEITQGNLMPGGFSQPEQPSIDTGEAYGLPAANLTVTIGYGPSLFDDRFGIAERRPDALAQLPRLPGDEMQAAISGGDLCIQACADDPLVAYHAIHDLTRIGIGVVTMRWMQIGFGRTSSTTTNQATARNLMGFKDGTRNLKVEEPSLVDRWVWARGTGGTAWMDGGSFLVARKIEMFVETWDHETLGGQEEIFGRVKDTGAPIGAESEFATPDLDAKSPDGDPVIAEDAHIRLASPAHNNGVHLLRRGYNYAEGVDQTRGNLKSGLFFLAFTSDPAHFVTVQRSLANHDSLNEYIKHVSSSVFACPRGLGAGQTWRTQLFG